VAEREMARRQTDPKASYNMNALYDGLIRSKKSIVKKGIPVVLLQQAPNTSCDFQRRREPLLPPSPRLPKRARAIRVNRRFTQVELSQRAGVSLGSYRRFEQGGRIEFVNLIGIAQTLGVDDDFESSIRTRW
jgi:DNA-binding XRE family transcriptional regulator